MKILQQAKNGVITNCQKFYEELTSEELKELRFAVGTTKKDYATYKVYRNKKNEIIRVVTDEFSKKKKQEIENYSKERSIQDFCNVMFGKTQSKSYRKSMKKYTDEETRFIRNLNK